MKRRRTPGHRIAPLVVLAALLVCPLAASASLMIDLRLPASSSTIPGVVVYDSKHFTPVHVAPGTRIPIDVFAVVRGPGSGFEGFQSAQGAFITTDSTHNLRGRILPAGDLDEATFTTTLPALSPFTGNGAQRGASKDISLFGDPDRVTDLGDDVRRGDIDRGDLVVFRSPGIQVMSGTVIPGGREFRIGRIELEYLESDGPTDFELNWHFRRNLDGSPSAEAALFRFDDTNPADGRHGVASGAPIVISVPEPAGIAVALVVPFMLTPRRAGRRGG